MVLAPSTVQMAGGTSASGKMASVMGRASFCTCWQLGHWNQRQWPLLTPWCGNRHPTGEVYEGEFRDGYRHGQGTLTSPNGDTYAKPCCGCVAVAVPVWLCGCRCGCGRCGLRLTDVIGDGNDRYTGEWVRGVYHGKAQFTKLNGHKFVGRAVRGVVQGPGILVTTEGEKYKGEWKDNRRHGRGSCYFPDNSVYTGHWERGQFHGVGRLVLANGDEYLGQWEFGQRTGHGVFRMASSGDIYAGQWVNGKAAGKGTYYYAATGNRYKGMFRGSQKHGLGEYVNWKKGRYIGNWFQGHIHGRGVFYWFGSGDQYRGSWAMGKKHGKVRAAQHGSTAPVCALTSALCGGAGNVHLGQRQYVCGAVGERQRPREGRVYVTGARAQVHGRVSQQCEAGSWPDGVL